MYPWLLAMLISAFSPAALAAMAIHAPGGRFQVEQVRMRRDATRILWDQMKPPPPRTGQGDVD